MRKPMLGRAVFLDRDGVINKEVEYLHRIADLRILPGVAKAIRGLNKKGYHVVVVSNQAMIARGIGTHGDVDAISREIEKRLARRGARIDKFYFCPHHPLGTVKRYAIRCRCRKPATGMVRKAAKDLHIDLKKSFFVGDATVDILTGQRSGLTTILVKTGYGGSDGRYTVVPDFIARDLLAATRQYIL